MDLIEVGGVRVVVHIQFNLIDAGQRVQYWHIRLCQLKHLGIEFIASFQPKIIFFVEKTLLLNAGHVEHIQMRQLCFEVGSLLVGLMERRQCLVLDVLGDAQFLRRNEHKPISLKLAEGCGQGVDRPAKFEIAAKANSQVIEPPFALADGH